MEFTYRGYSENYDEIKRISDELSNRTPPEFLQRSYYQAKSEIFFQKFLEEKDYKKQKRFMRKHVNSVWQRILIDRDLSN